jgi:WD40 repeat protein
MATILLGLLFFLTALSNGAFAFLLVAPFSPRQEAPAPAPASAVTLQRFFASENDNDDDDNWQSALRQRQLSFQQRQDETRKRWRFADFQQVGVPIPDWVRRVSVQWPLAACGTATGDVYLVNVESGVVVGKGPTKEDQHRYADVPLDDPKLTTTLKQLFGDFDGGGTLAIGLSSWTNIIAHAGRNGGVELWGIDASSSSSSSSSSDSEEVLLISQGTLLEGVVVTSLDWAADDDLWIGTQDGRVLVYTVDDDMDNDGGDNELPSTPAQEWKDLGGTILSISFHEELNVAVATTTSGVVELLTMDDPTSGMRRSFYPPFDSGRMRSNVFALCATIVKETNDDPKRQFSIACGGNDGSLYIQPLRLLDEETTKMDPELDLDRPFSDVPIKALAPHHRGPCKCLASPFPGILLSGGQDGTIRVWDLNAEDDKSTCLYVLSGTKAWLGSLWTDGEHLVMDGSDNAISIFNFGEHDEE